MQVGDFKLFSERVKQARSKLQRAFFNSCIILICMSTKNKNGGMFHGNSDPYY